MKVRSSYSMRVCFCCAPRGRQVASEEAQGQLTFEPPSYAASAGAALLTESSRAGTTPSPAAARLQRLHVRGQHAGDCRQPDSAAHADDRGRLARRRRLRLGPAHAGLQLPAARRGRPRGTSWACSTAFLPAVENLGSFSLQPSTTNRYWQQLMNWGTHAATADLFDINYGVFDATGVTHRLPLPRHGLAGASASITGTTRPRRGTSAPTSSRRSPSPT